MTYMKCSCLSIPSTSSYRLQRWVALLPLGVPTPPGDGGTQDRGWLPASVFFSALQLLDLCVLDVGCLEFPYGVLAASALYHFSSSELMQKVSGMLAFQFTHKKYWTYKSTEPNIYFGCRVSVVWYREVCQVDGSICHGYKGDRKFQA